jgi:hypothetical protein
MDTSPSWLAQVHTIYRSAVIPREGQHYALCDETPEQALLSTAIQMLARQLGTELGRENTEIVNKDVEST